MKTRLLALLAITVSLLFYSCYYDKADLLYPNGAASVCDTTSSSYSQKIVPLLNSKCYSCHSVSSSGGGIVMGTYSADKVIVTNGKLYGSITHASGFSPMPQGEAKMNACQIAIIKKWIDSGSPNN